jgi:hypothetical protein
LELGYQRVELGPTSNFVGNHMTQGAIDLVQAELSKSDAQKAAIGPLLLPGRIASEEQSGQAEPTLTTVALANQESDLPSIRRVLRQRRRQQHHMETGGAQAQLGANGS